MTRVRAVERVRWAKLRLGGLLRMLLGLATLLAYVLVRAGLRRSDIEVTRM